MNGGRHRIDGEPSRSDGRRDWLLAIDTATSRAVVAAAAPDGTPLGVTVWAAGRTHGEQLLPAIGRLHGEANLRRSRIRGLIVVLWRAGLRISEALALLETDLDQARGAILIRQGKGGKRREVGMDRWGWQQLAPWLAHRATLPVGALFCVLRGPTRGRRAHRPVCAPN